MAQKLLKAKKGKIAAKPMGSRVPRDREIVLVGTYRENQLAWIKRHGVYNYPVRDDDKFDVITFAAIKELWLYADVKSTRHAFAAEFVGKMTREEFLAANPSYGKLKPSKPLKKARPTNKAYYVFKVTPIVYESLDAGKMVVTRLGDFGSGRTAKVKKAIEQYKADGEFAPLSSYLPSDLAKVPREQLRVCEAAVQLAIWSPVKPPSEEYEQIADLVFCIEEFGRRYELPSAKAFMYLKKYKALEYLEEYQHVNSCLPMESLIEDMSCVCRNHGGRL